MTKKKGLFILCLLLATGLSLRGQSFETGGLVGAAYEMKILKGWHWGVDGELRFDCNFTHYDRLKLGVGTDYTFWKKRLKVGIAYDYLNYHQEGWLESRHRVGAFVSYTQKIQRCKLSYRALFQSTFRDERRGDYTFNPKTYMRNRLSFSYNVPDQPLRVHLSEECWWRLYHPDRKIVDALRTVAGVEYNIDKHHALDFFLRMDNEIQVSDPEHTLMLGVVYQFK